MTQTDLQPNCQIEMAIDWIMSPRERTGTPTVIELKERFGLSAVQACDAIAEAHLRKARAT